MTGWSDDRDMGTACRDESEEHALLAEVLAALRASADGPPPEPTAALAQVLRSGLPAQHGEHRRGDSGGRARRWRAAVRLGAAGLGAKLVLGAGVATASVAGVAAVEGPAGPVHRGVTSITSAVDGLLGGAGPRPAPPAPQPLDDGRESAVPTPLTSAPAQLPPRATPPAAPIADPGDHAGDARVPRVPAQPTAGPAAPPVPGPPSPTVTSTAPTPPRTDVREEPPATPAPPAAPAPATPPADADRDGATPPVTGGGTPPTGGRN